WQPLAAAQSEAAASAQAALLEAVAETDEALLDRYLAEGLPPAGSAGEAEALAAWRAEYALAAARGELFPVLFGASSKGIGIQQLMDAVNVYLPAPAANQDAPLSGVVFRIERDKAMGRMAYVRLYGGAIHNRDTVRNATQGIDEKVTQIRKVD